MKLEEMKVGDGKHRIYLFWCPGCKERHHYDVGRPERPNWTFNGDFQSPTFTPSLLYPSKPIRCHLFLTNGVLIYCNDCDHNLAAMRVPLPDLPEEFIMGDRSS